MNSQLTPFVLVFKKLLQYANLKPKTSLGPQQSFIFGIDPKHILSLRKTKFKGLVLPLLLKLYIDQPHCKQLLVL